MKKDGRMRVLVLGGDGFCGWPTALHLSARGWDVLVVDNLSRRSIDNELEVQSLTPIRPMGERIAAWKEISGRTIDFVNLTVEDGVGMFSLIERETGLWLGRIGPWTPLGWPGTEVGWGLHPDAQGKGYGVEAATAAIDYAFDVLDWTEVIHCIDPDNTPSQRLAERLGSRNLGPTKLPPPFDAVSVDRWGQSREQWRARA